MSEALSLVHEIDSRSTLFEKLPPDLRRRLDQAVIDRDYEPRLAADHVDLVIEDNLPLIVITTSEMERDRSRAYGAHANSYVVKPIDFGRFHQMIRDLRLYCTVWNEPPV